MKRTWLFLLSLIVLLSVGITSYATENDITRGEFIHMVVDTLSLTYQKADANFPDVLENSPYYDAFLYAKGIGLIKGDEFSNANPNDTLTRCEAAAILGRATHSKEKSENFFKDKDIIPSWAMEYIKGLSDLNIIHGHTDGTFKPYDNLTVSEGKTLIENLKKSMFFSGDGTKDDPYIITKPYHFLNIRLYPDKYFKIENDLSFDKDVIFDSVESFKGVLDGAGHKITNLTTTVSGKQAIFDRIENGAVVMGINLVCPDEFFKISVVNNGKILNSGNSSFNYNPSKKYFEKEDAGITHTNNGEISGCYNSSYLYYKSMAGIAVENNGKIINCFNTASGPLASGIAVKGKGEIKASYNVGDVLYPISEKVKATDSYYTGKAKNGEGIQRDIAFITAKMEDYGFSYSNKYKIPVNDKIYYIQNEDFSLYGGGDGSKDNPYLIENATHFDNIRKNTKSFFKLSADIDFSGALGYEPIEEFSGVLNGNGYTIYNFKLTDPERETASLIYENNGRIENLRLVNAYLMSKNIASSIAIINNLDIVGCYVDGSVNSNIGAGLIYENNAFIENSAFAGSVNAYISSGISHKNNFEIVNTLNYAKLFGNECAGFCYENSGKIFTSCYFGEIYSNNAYSASYVNTGDIDKCYYSGNALAVGENNGNANLTKRTTVQMQEISAFESLSKDYWTMGKKGPVLKDVTLYEREENIKDFAGGDGSAGNPYKIVTPSQFIKINDYPNASFILNNDLDMSRISSEFLGIQNFSGVLFGNKKTVSGINAESLFIINTGVISDLYVKQSKVSFGIAKENKGTILRCLNACDIQASEGAGIAKTNKGNIYECFNTGDITGEQSAGIVLYNMGKIASSHNAGNIDGDIQAFGITDKGEVLNSLTTGYVYSSYDKAYPLSNGEYNNSYYLDRYEKKEKGALTLKQITKKDSFKGFDALWNFEKGVPVLEIFKDVSYPMPKAFSGGDGTKNNPYLIATVDDLHNIRMYPDAHFKLTKDIIFSKKDAVTASDKGFIPISEFSGSLDGGNYTLYDFVINSDEDAGLFGVNLGEIKNLNLVRFTVTGNENAGGITGINKGDIISVSVTSSRIGALGSAGGISGTNTKKIENAYSDAYVFGTLYAGGISGVNNYLITNSQNHGGVISFSDTENSYSGGISGISRSRISFCVNSGKVISNSDKKESSAGGISGIASGSIENSVNFGEISSRSGMSAYAGGIVGKAPEKLNVLSSLNTGYTITNAKNSYQGSLVGFGKGKIIKCLYDETLSQPLGDGEFTFSELHPVNDFTDEKWIKLLGELNWQKGRLYPELIKNPYKENPLKDNIRDFAGGNGSYENPFIIITPEQLNNVRYYPGSCFMLISDLDMSAFCQRQEFKPIGDDMFAFFGTFLGNGCTIRGIKSEKGLFSVNHGEIYEIILEDFEILGTNAGTVAEKNTGTIYRCTVKGKKTEIETDGFVFLGGISNINYSTGMIISCLNQKDFEINASGVQLGGIVNVNHGIVAGSQNEGNININSRLYSVNGGITGANYNTLSDCLNKGEVISKCDTQNISGSISGTNGGTILNAISEKGFNIIHNDTGSTFNSGHVSQQELIFGLDLETTWELKGDGALNLREILYWFLNWYLLSYIKRRDAKWKKEFYYLQHLFYVLQFLA